MKKTLLQKAREIDKSAQKTDFSVEEIELVEEYLNGDLRLKAIMAVLGYKHPGQTYAFIARAARQLWQERTR